MHPQLVRVTLASILHQFRDAYDLEIMPGAEADQIGYTRHRTVIVQDFADRARRIQPSETSEIDRRFRMASPFQYAIPAGTEREDVARPCQIFRART